MPLRTTSQPILPQRRGGVSLADLLQQLRRRDPLTAEAVEIVANAHNSVVNTLRQAPPSIEDFIVTDPTGAPIARIGSWVEDGVMRSGFWTREFYQAGEGPDTAVLYSDENGNLIIGKNGSATVLDPFGGTAAWIGAQWDTLDVTGAANNGTGLIRLTVALHGLITGDEVLVGDVGGVPNATGIWTVTVIDPNTIDLQESGFGGAYTSGGWVSRVLHVTGAADNGSGLIRLTIAGHGYESGDTVNVHSVGGVANATGQWIVTVVDANHIDLEGSAFAGAYGGGGICVRYFAGGLFQNIAIGAGFDNYSLRAFPDGTLKIHNAEIVLDGTEATITLDPDEGLISVVGKNAYNVIVELSSLADPVAGDPAGMLVRNGLAPNDEYAALGYQGLTVVGGGLVKSLVGVGAVHLYDGTGTETVALFGGTGNGTFAGNFDAYDYAVGAVTVITHARNGSLVNLGLSGDLSIGGSTAIDSGRNATLTSVDSGAYSVSGVPGVGASQDVVTVVTPNVSTINYKDHSGSNASMSVVTGLSVTTVTRTFSGGLLTG